MSANREPFDWMHEAIYEPAPARYSARRAWVLPVSISLSLIAIVTGGLIAWSNAL